MINTTKENFKRYFAMLFKKAGLVLFIMILSISLNTTVFAENATAPTSSTKKVTSKKTQKKKVK